MVAAVALLLGFYAWVGYRALNPNVSPHYRAYFIERSVSDWLPSHYAARPEDGFDFAQPGLPEFVASVRGVSDREALGRWSDARRGAAAAVVFVAPLEGTVCLGLALLPAPWQVGRPVGVSLDGIRQEFVPSREESQWFWATFVLSGPASELLIEPSAPAAPAQKVPGSTDRRLLGVALQRLVLRPGACGEEFGVKEGAQE